MEDDWGQGVLPYWKREKISWCGCREGKEQSGTQARDSRGAAREEASVPCKGKSAGRRKEVEESRRKQSGTHG